MNITYRRILNLLLCVKNDFQSHWDKAHGLTENAIESHFHAIQKLNYQSVFKVSHTYTSAFGLQEKF